MTTTDRRVLVHPDKEALAGSVAARFITKVIDILDEVDEAHIVLTGGTMGAAVLESVRASAASDTIDWGRLHFWWGDERFVPKNDPDRNELQAREALLDHVPVDESKVHPFPSSDEIDDLDEAARVYAAELAAAAPEGRDYPRFAIMFLGVGPDGHIASLFPGHDEIRITDKTVVPVRNSPKPPPLRLSLTLPVIQSADRIWMVLAGADKASAIGLALAGASTDEVPVAGAQGRKRTVFFVDREAAAEVPESLIAPSY
ncbi:6-phosphogluconolactonase [Herbiconiux sp. KACC 21604]|uniref:6-phosphogluconolactonase n=1 Tax=unclassified Herbiconiux TaxID=2618217 RepID=UPI001490FEDA|nr:6-phosphogluconolactonase [Herbiconiux sp. SALV-R1]QJU53555.1 6-phosphogluconolactonase [Herbiconiux sp. SALV-R1]WPO88536.1 6-phosphogluconolactonase [Herbiconiux sp. KACC 21604]